MSITNDTVEEVYSGTGLATAFPTNIVAFEASQISVYLREDDVDTLQTLTTHYTISNLKEVASLAENDVGVTITFTTAPAADQEVVVVRETTLTQQLALTSTRAYNPEVLMYQLDRTIMMMQELSRLVDRSFKVLPGLDAPMAVTDGDALADLVSYASQAAASAAAAAASAASALAKENSMLRARGNWVTATAYTPSDIVRQGTTQYICLIAHTSGTFATDLSAARWEVWLQDGAAGPGSGDLLSTQNLADLADVNVAVTNLGFSVLGAFNRNQGGLSAHTPGTNAQGQGVIASNVTFAYCSTVTSTSGVTLPATGTDQQGRECTIVNPSGSTASINVYPSSGQNFVGLAVNLPVPVPPGWQLTAVQQAAGSWFYTLQKQQAFDNPVKCSLLFDGTTTGGTYTRSGTLITVTMAGHGLITGQQVQLDFTTGTATDGHYVVTVVDANTFTVTDTVSGATNGNVTRLTTILRSQGIASVARTAGAEYLVTYSTPMSSDHYVWQVSCSKPSDSNWVYWAQPKSPGDILAASIRIRSGYVSGTAAGGYNASQDLARISLTVYENL